jgi:hypothetical protein
VLWLFAWFAGWNNSFNKGYELAAAGPLTGLLGVFVFIGVMFYVPLAQTRQAVTGQWRDFYDFRVVWEIVRTRRVAFLGLSLLYSALALPLMLLKTLPGFFPQINPPLADATTQQVKDILGPYFFFSALLVLPFFVLLRLVAARIYASGLLRAIRTGRLPADVLSALERPVSRKLELLGSEPLASRKPVRLVLRRVAADIGATLITVATGIAWFTFVAQIFIAQFFTYHPGIGWLNQPLVQLPWFRYLPSSVRDPAGEVGLSLLVLLLIFAVRFVKGRLIWAHRQFQAKP